ncbi:hypothetical protein D3C85_1787800 [compost metagenome]
MAPAVLVPAHKTDKPEGSEDLAVKADAQARQALTAAMADNVRPDNSEANVQQAVQVQERLGSKRAKWWKLRLV